MIQSYTGESDLWDAVWALVDQHMMDPSIPIDVRKKLVMGRHGGIMQMGAPDPLAPPPKIPPVGTPARPLEMKDLTAGLQYRFTNGAKGAAGARCILLKKNRTKVQVKLLEDGTKWAKDTVLNTPPSCLIPI